MADLEKGTAAAPARSADTQTDFEDLPALFGRLSDGVVTLLDTKLRLFKVEVKEDVNGYIKGATTVIVGGIIAAVGFAIVNVAVAILVGALLPQSLGTTMQFALGFVITGAAYLLIGGILMLAAKKRLANQGLVPERSIAELRKDKEWLTKEL